MKASKSLTARALVELEALDAGLRDCDPLVTEIAREQIALMVETAHPHQLRLLLAGVIARCAMNLNEGSAR